MISTMGGHNRRIRIVLDLIDGEKVIQLMVDFLNWQKPMLQNNRMNFRRIKNYNRTSFLSLFRRTGFSSPEISTNNSGEDPLKSTKWGNQLLITKGDIAEMLRISNRTVERGIAVGNIPRPDFYANGHPRWKPDTIRKWLIEWFISQPRSLSKDKMMLLEKSREISLEKSNKKRNFCGKKR